MAEQKESARSATPGSAGPAVNTDAGDAPAAGGVSGDDDVVVSIDATDVAAPDEDTDVDTAPTQVSLEWEQPTSSDEEEEFVKPVGSVVYQHRPKSTCRRVTEWVLLTIVCLAAVGVLFYFSRAYVGEILKWHRQLDGWQNILVYFTVFFVVCLPMFFGYVIACVGAGYIYGICYGTLMTAVSTLISSAIVFELSRFCCRAHANRIAAGHANFHAIRTVLEEPGLTGVKMIAMLRLSPVPVGVGTMMLAVCDMTVWWQSLGSFVGMLPTQVLYCFIGSTLPSMDDVVDGKFNPWVVATEAVLMVLVTWYIGVTVHRAMRDTAKKYAVENGLVPLLGDGTEGPRLHTAAYHSLDDVDLAYARDMAGADAFAFGGSPTETTSLLQRKLGDGSTLLRAAPSPRKSIGPDLDAVGSPARFSADCGRRESSASVGTRAEIERILSGPNITVFSASAYEGL